MAGNRRTQRFIVVSPSGHEYYGRRDAKGRFKKAGNEIDYVFKKMEEAANLTSAALFRELSKMSQAFFNSYVTGAGGDKMPMDTGNLIDSTSILLARGERNRRAIHVTGALAVKPQHWGNWNGIGAGSGYGEDYRMEDIDEVMGIGKNDMAVSFRVGIPYAVPLNNSGSHGKHAGFFDDMAEDFRANVMDISQEVAASMSNGSDEALIFEGAAEV